MHVAGFQASAAKFRLHAFPLQVFSFSLGLCVPLKLGGAPTQKVRQCALDKNRVGRRQHAVGPWIVSAASDFGASLVFPSRPPKRRLDGRAHEDATRETRGCSQGRRAWP